MIASFSGYISFIEKYCKGDNILFRGQREDKPLIPKIGRIPLKSDFLKAENKELQIIVESQQELIYSQAQEINDLHLLLGGV